MHFYCLLYAVYCLLFLLLPPTPAEACLSCAFRVAPSGCSVPCCSTRACAWHGAERYVVLRTLFPLVLALHALAGHQKCRKSRDAATRRHDAHDDSQRDLLGSPAGRRQGGFERPRNGTCSGDVLLRLYDEPVPGRSSVHARLHGWRDRRRQGSPQTRFSACDRFE